MAEKTVGILTGGGDCPGLNAVIRAAVRKGITQYDYRFKGIQKGWKGMMECDWEPLGLKRFPVFCPRVAPFSALLIVDESLQRGRWWRHCR